jgi:CRP/FNR family transcriptional regulator, cyclic AMP receptor protein
MAAGPAVTTVGARRSLLLSALPSEDLDELLGRSRVVRVGEGHHLARADDTFVATVLQGAIAATCFGAGGHAAIVSLLGPGSSWGLPTVFGHPGPATELRALSEVAALVVPGAELRRCVAKRPAVAQACLESLAQDLTRQRHEEAVLAHASTFERVVHRLVELATRWGVPDGRDRHQVRVPLPLTQEDLALWACASQKSTVKALSQLRLAGILRTGRRHLTVLDLPALRERDPEPRAGSELEQLLGFLR